MEVTTLFDRQGTEDDTSNLVLTEWGWGEPDVLYMMTDTSSGIGLYRPKPYRDLVSQARVVSDLDERAAIYFEAMKVMLADAAMVPLWTSLDVTGVRSEVKGFKLGALGTYLYQDA